MQTGLRLQTRTLRTEVDAAGVAVFLCTARPPATGFGGRRTGDGRSTPASRRRPRRAAGSPPTSPRGSTAARRRQRSRSTRSATCSSRATARPSATRTRADARGAARARSARVRRTGRCAELEGAADDVARWRAGLADTSRYRLTLALRQTLGAAVRWRYLTRNPAVDAGRNPEPRSRGTAAVHARGDGRGRGGAGAGVRAARRVLPPRPGCARTSGPRPSAATLTARARRWSSSGATRTAC